MESSKSCQVKSYRSSLWPRERNKAGSVSQLVQGPESHTGDYFQLTNWFAERCLPNYRQIQKYTFKVRGHSFQQLAKEQLVAFRQWLRKKTQTNKKQAFYLTVIDMHEEILAKAFFLKRWWSQQRNFPIPITSNTCNSLPSCWTHRSWLCKKVR